MRILGSTIALAAMVLLFQNCAEDLPSDLNTASSSSSSPAAPVQLNAAPSAETIDAGSAIELMVSGGQPPYTFAVTSGAGSVSPEGVFTAPEASGTSLIEITDSVGAKATSQITSVLPLTFQSMPVTPTNDQTLQLTGEGGVPPYTFTLISGTGSLAQAIYTPTLADQQVTIQIQDSRGRQTRRMISFSPGCGGTLVAGRCWHLGAFGESCQTVCASRGGYNGATSTYAGQSGTRSRCESVLVALGQPPNVLDYACSVTPAAGCLVHLNGNRVRCVNAPTTANAAYSRYRRACACNN